MKINREYNIFKKILLSMIFLKIIINLKFGSSNITNDSFYIVLTSNFHINENEQR